MNHVFFEPASRSDEIPLPCICHSSPGLIPGGELTVCPKTHQYVATNGFSSFTAAFGDSCSAIRRIQSRTLLWAPSAPTTMLPLSALPSVHRTTTPSSVVSIVDTSLPGSRRCLISSGRAPYNSCINSGRCTMIHPTPWLHHQSLLAISVHVCLSLSAPSPTIPCTKHQFQESKTGARHLLPPFRGACASRSPPPPRGVQAEPRASKCWA